MPRYVIDRLIGEGGLAQVYRARALGDAGFARVVAVKRLLPELAGDAAVQQRFIDEARIAGSLRHPCIVGVTDFFLERGVQHLVMEHVDGTSVERLCARGRGGRFVPPAVAAQIVHEVARALEYAHRAGVLHRDVSACNILVSREGEVKLADFGLADARDRVSKTVPGDLTGKLGYLSPERRAGAPATPSDDLYALGIVLERLLVAADPRERSRPPGPALASISAALTEDRSTRLPSAAALLESVRPLRCATAEEVALVVRASADPPRAPGPPRPYSAEALDESTAGSNEHERTTDPAGSGSVELTRSRMPTILDDHPLWSNGRTHELPAIAPRRRSRWAVLVPAAVALALAGAAVAIVLQ